MASLPVRVLETQTIARCKGPMMAAGLNVVPDTNPLTPPGIPNPDTLDPIISSCSELGLPTADPSTVTDSDLALFSSPLQARLKDLVEIRVLETCYQYALSRPKAQRWVKYSVESGDFVQYLDKLIKEKWETYYDTWTRSGAIETGQMYPQIRHVMPDRYDYLDGEYIYRGGGGFF